MYKVEITNQGGSLFRVRSKDYDMTIDTEGKGITPPDALLASLGSCIGVYLRKYGEKTSLEIKEFTISVWGELSKERPVAFRKIEVSIDLKGVSLDEMRMKSLLQFIRNCPIHNTLEVHPEVSIQII